VRTNCSCKLWCEAQGFPCANCTPERHTARKRLASEDRERARRVNTRLRSESGLKA